MTDPERDASRAALERYRQRMLRSRGIYLSVVGVIVIALAVTVGVAWQHGEAAHTELRTVAQPPATLPAGRPPNSLTKAWSTTDRAASGSPRWNGTVITFSAHTVGGRDAATGRRTWSYTRTDRTVCTAAQTGGVTVAIFELHGNCDEVTALASGTGDRLWTRTLDEDGQPLDGRPTVQITSLTVMITSPTVIYAIDPGNGGDDSGGIDRWTYSRDGCRIHSAVLGSNGALVSQTCRHTACKGVKFCAQGPQLFLRDATAGLGDSGKPNRDAITWLDRDATAVPASADDLVSALTPSSGVLRVLDPDKGNVIHTVPLSPRPATSTLTDVTAASDTELITFGADSYAVASGNAQVRWHARFGGPPVLTQGGGSDTRPIAATEVTAVTRGAVLMLRGANGAVERRLAAPGVTSGRAYPLGHGMLVAAASGTAAYN